MAIRRYLLLGALQGAFAWSAYSIGEFVVSSVFGLARPYAELTPWHWQLTSLLIAGYLLAGLLAGALAGLILYLFTSAVSWVENTDTASVLEAGGTLTLVAAFGANLLAHSSGDIGRVPLLGLSVIFCLLLVAAIRSEKVSERLGLLTNPWIVAIVLLGTGQIFGLLKLREDGSPAGGKAMVFAAGLAVVLLAIVVASVFAGRRLRARFARRPAGKFAPAGAALALACGLLAVSAWLGWPRISSAEAQAAAVQSSSQPNVVIMVMDTVRADHLSLHGYSRRTTPNLEALARDSVVYKNAIAPSDMTLSSHGSLFTGLYAGWHGAHCSPPEASYGRPLSPNVTTLAGILAANGYSTTGVSANVYLRENFGLQRGFQRFRIPRPVPVLSPESWYLLRRGMRRTLTHFVDTAQFDRLFARAEDVNQSAFELMNGQVLARGPFFLFLNYMDAHFPYVPPAPFDTRFPGKIRSLTQDELTEVQEAVVSGHPMSAEEHAHFISQYDGGIAYVDAHIGQVIQWLKRRGVYNNTMIVVVSDHGEQFGEKNLVLHGNSIYQALLHVPMVIKFPGNKRTGVVDEPVSLIDVAPTILSALELPVPENMQGIDLLTSDPANRKQLFSESFPCPALHRSDCPQEGCRAQAVFSWPLKYASSSSGRRELFDLAKDSREDHNILGKEPQVAKELSLELSRWLKTVPVKAGQQSGIEAETLQQLKSLGYVQ
ncbi:MAG TPA: sulfatase [Bryobacteraceae bacterium]|nr:sulfatase [Bryobacteraceae bacterium]